MSYRFINPAPVLFNIAGTEPAAGGSLTFYERGTTTDKDTWSDEAMGDPNLNANPVPLDSSGRANTEIWLDGEYTCVLKDSLGATIWTRDLVSEADSGVTIPALESGAFLTNDGTNLLWQAILTLLLPDMSGQTGKWLSNDGANPIWGAAPVAAEVASTSTSFRIGLGGGTHLLIQCGTDTAPASGTAKTTKAVSFGEEFDTIFIVIPVCTSDSQPGGPIVPTLTAAPSVTGFTASFDVAEGDPSDQNIVNPVPFSWIAFGLIADPTA